MAAKVLKIILILICYAACSFSQNLDKIGQKDMLKTGGGLNFSSILYDANGIPDRRQPFSWYLNGTLSATILDISLPFTFNYSNNQVAYTQPYMLQSFNPSYKKIKGYAGITSMNFSPYTLSGHLFSGAGIEFTPKKFKFSAMYGRLKKAVEYDMEHNSDVTMSYKRMGYGATAGYEKNGQGVKLIYFAAKDDPNSLTFLPINTSVTPMKNTVVSISGKTSLYKKLKLEAEYSLSGLTRSLSTSEEIKSTPKNRLPYIFKPNATSQFFDAVKTSIGYNYKFFNVNFIYERIDPEYKTLGAYYFNNDLENITLAPSFNLLKGKLSFSCNTGLQRNNLDNSKLSTSRRWVGSVNANYAPNKSWNFTGSYSNFSTYTKQRPQSDPFYQNKLDTLNFYQLSQNSSFTSNYNFGKNEKKQALLLSVNYQVTGQDHGMLSDQDLISFSSNTPIPAKVVNGNLGHSISFTKAKTTLSSSVNANYSQLTGLNTLYFGPNLNVSRSLTDKKLRITIGSSYNQVLTNEIKTNEILNHRFSLNYSPKFSNVKAGKITMNTSISYLQKLKTNSAGTGFSEFTGNFGINYNF